ncbi:MAG TPA: hypothetical protein VFG86_26795 [Chloroflexota bacterium]|jgi:hypothetical protein|nr:hypothetical protein [Chloroflexota bacterium]
MSNSSLYVKLDPQTFEWLQKTSKEERRAPGDQAAVLLRKVRETIEAETEQQAVAA